MQGNSVVINSLWKELRKSGDISIFGSNERHVCWFLVRIIGPPVDEWEWWKIDLPHSSEMIALGVVRAQNSARAAP
jgi:hypothetical protein